MEKLVRDRIPEIILSKGEPVTYRIAPADDLETLLLLKLVEECDEAYLAKGEAELFEELVDVLAVVEGLVLRMSDEYSMPRLVERALEKAKQRGGFTKGVVMVLPDVITPEP